MINLKIKINNEKQTIFLISLGVLYFVFLLRFYLIDYYIPDFGVYYYFAVIGEKARDGFSSLFILFSSLIAKMPTVVNLFCLVLMTLTMINISFFIKSMFKEANLYLYFCILILYSCGAFYYFYGKIFYEFPFTAFNYSICLLFLCKLYSKLEHNFVSYNIWYALCFGLGFTLSWKPYNIFCVAGLGLLLFLKTNSKKLVISIFKSIKKILLSVFYFVIGYLSGNYNLLIDLKQTIKGIRAYPASSSFKDFLLSKNRIAWDHVNIFPFNTSVMLLLTAIVILFILPILFKKYYYLLVSTFMTINLYFYIHYFSPGYTWHAFPMALFIVTFIVFLLSDNVPIDNYSYKNIIISLALGLQIISNFFYYIPLQIKWHTTTQEAIKVLENKESEIFSDVVSMISEIGDSYFKVDIAIKRYRFISKNKFFLDPLESTNYLDWMHLKQNKRYTDDKALYQYIIWIIPDCFKTMGDIANINIYNKFEIIDHKHKSGYSVYLYKVL